ncbi:restriction endonuclease subunit S [Paenibacillus sp. EKM208P]|nr:restriction endonuclease subunit S [Paenibacillus sp. EKM208P]
MQQFLTRGIGHTEFKQTELGRIPFLWSIKRIGEITEVKTGGTPSRTNNSYWENGTIPWMSSGEINLKKVYSVKEKITEQGYRNSNTTLLPIGTVMLAMNGQGKTRGTAAILRCETTCNQSLAGILPSLETNSDYLYYYLDSCYEDLRSLTGEGRSGLNLSLIRDFSIKIPPFAEQQKIAEILSTVDEQIDVYEKEKEKQLELKKGLMQQLLTGNIRVMV